MKLMTYFNAYQEAQSNLGRLTMPWNFKKHDDKYINFVNRKSDQLTNFRSGLIKRLEKIDAENEEHATRLKWLFDDRDNWEEEQNV